MVLTGGMICGSFRIISMPPVNTHFSRADCYFLFFRFQSPELCLTENQADFLWVLNTPLKFRGGNNTPDFATGEKQTKIVSTKAEQISPFLEGSGYFCLTVFLFHYQNFRNNSKKTFSQHFIFPRICLITML